MDLFKALVDTEDTMAIKAYVQQMPTVEPKKGKWISKGLNYDGYELLQCSECADISVRLRKELNFCRNCGADMRGEKK